MKNLVTSMRTHTCGELGSHDIDKEVSLCGWVATKRNLGKLIFIDLRDRYGITQVIFKPGDKTFKEAEKLRKEFVVQLKGKVSRRPKGMENSNIKTGKIEVIATDLKILSEALPSPFPIKDGITISDDVRLQYRFLDLRRPEMQKNFEIRNACAKAAREYLDKHGFIELETPMLVKPTPEGARDYVVPSRVNTGKFYALPQSPQLYKQILMIAGFDRYYQLARCLRDEDLRQDRQPEHTQIDLEMSFVNMQDIMNLVENMIKYIVKKVLSIDLKEKFPVIQYDAAIKKYGTDKPDLRKKKNELKFCWVTDFPLFAWDEDEKKWTPEHHIFTMPQDKYIKDLEKNPGKVKGKLFDLILNGTEIGSGSIRINNPELQERVMKIIGLSKKTAHKKFGFLLDAYKYGGPVHGGIGIGFDRFVALLRGFNDIREVILFPKNKSAQCLMDGSPSDIDELQLKDLNIKVDIKKKK